jgi:hypothetical protein
MSDKIGMHICNYCGKGVGAGKIHICKEKINEEREIRKRNKMIGPGDLERIRFGPSKEELEIERLQNRVKELEGLLEEFYIISKV